MRSLYKGPFIDYTILRQKLKLLKEKKNNIYSKNSVLTLRTRRSTILPFLENTGLKIYNGQNYVWLSTKLHHVGFKIGDFGWTKKKCNPKKLSR
jgi:ribosomal protein S19